MHNVCEVESRREFSQIDFCFACLATYARIHGNNKIGNDAFDFCKNIYRL